MSKSQGNNGKNLDLMMSVRYEPEKHEVTGEALIELQKLKDLVSVFEPIKINKVKTKTRKTKQIMNIPVKELIKVYKWLPQLCNMAVFLPIFSEVINKDMVKIEDVPKFDKLMYKVMGE